MVEILWDKKFKNCAIFWDLLQRVILKINVLKRIHILILQVKSLITYLISISQFFNFQPVVMVYEKYRNIIIANGLKKRNIQ